MKWVNHCLVGGATTALINPLLVPIGCLGSTAPDWLEWVLNALGKKVKHRTITHYVSVWFVGILFGAFVWDFHGLVTAFCWGGFTHVMVDAMTVSGVPFGPYSDRRFHLFGGRFRTGDPVEYAISFGVVAICAVLIQFTYAVGWYPFFYDWGGLYSRGVIDGYEWKINRFRLL